jgi:hypothetical protein
MTNHQAGERCPVRSDCIPAPLKNKPPRRYREVIVDLRVTGKLT